MAKSYSPISKASGKLGSVVYANVGGVQVSREYNGAPRNPKTTAQTQQRAKLKLISQLAAVAAPIIAIKREGLKSGRNIFSSQNFGLVGYADNTASIDLTKIQLAKGTMPMPAITITTPNPDKIGLDVAEVINPDITKIAIAILEQDTDGNLVVKTSKVIDNPGTTDLGFVPCSLTENYKYTALVYGVRPNSEKAHVVLDNLNAPTAASLAQVIATRSLSTSDATLTRTVGAAALYEEEGPQA